MDIRLPTFSRLRYLLVFFTLMVLFACAMQDGAWRKKGILHPPRTSALWEFYSGASSPALSDGEEEEEEEKASPLGTALLYLPNRIFDVAEIARFGVNVGGGLGADLRATWLAQAAIIHDTSVGVGFQGLRHLPVCFRMGHSVIGAGPIRTPSLGLFDWPVNDYDVRVELFLLIVGAHVALDLEAIYDFFAGLLTFDPSEDDFVMGG